MSEYMFGTGDGWKPKRADKIARKHDAWLINSNKAQCTCGYGCAPYECKRSRYHWFATRSMGAPFDGQTRDAVMADLKKAGIINEDEE